MQAVRRFHQVALRATAGVLKMPQMLCVQRLSVARYSDGGTLSVSLDGNSGKDLGFAM